MITNSVICCEPREEARAIALRHGARLPRHHGEPVPRHDAEVAGRHHVAERSALAARSRRRRRRGPPRRPHRGRVPAVRHPDEVSEQIARGATWAWTSSSSAFPHRRHPPRGRSSPASSSRRQEVIPQFDPDRTLPPTATGRPRSRSTRHFVPAAARRRRVADGHPRGAPAVGSSGTYGDQHDPTRLPRHQGDELLHEAGRSVTRHGLPR